MERGKMVKKIINTMAINSKIVLVNLDIFQLNEKNQSVNIKKSEDHGRSKATLDMVYQRNLVVTQVEGVQNLVELNTPMPLEVCHAEDPTM